MSGSGKKPRLNCSHVEATGGHLHAKNRRQVENLEHLLSFTLPPRANHRTAPGGRPKSSSKQHVPYTRERFVHAQYRFVLNPTGDYTAHFSDPDIYHYWPNVLQVIVNCSAESSIGTDLSTLSDREEQENFCPICLSEPSAPRMTKCGHIFCYPCLLHLFELSDVGKWIKCPLCTDTIHPKDLKSVSFYTPTIDAGTSIHFEQDAEANIIHEGDRVTLKLMERPKMTTLALPRSATWPSDAVPPLATPWVFSPDAYTFARFMIATPEYMLAALNKDLMQLDTLSAGSVGYNEGDLEGSFVSSAKRKIREQIDKAESLKTNAVMNAKRQSAKDIQIITEQSRKRADRLSVHQPVASTSASSSSEDTDDIPDVFYAIGAQGGQYNRPVKQTAAPESLPGRAKKNLNPPPTDSVFSFYQASNGANVFLHPLDIRILKAHYEQYSSFPDTVTVSVEGKEEGSMNEDLKRRCRYLSHLPAASDITFLEVDLEPLVGPKALEPYANALKQRKNKRKDKAKREEKAKKLSDERERAKHERDFRIPTAFSTVHYFDEQSQPELVLPHHDPQIDDDHFPSMTPPSPSFLPVDLSTPSSRTVWGTRAVPVTSPPRPSPAELLPTTPANDQWSDMWKQLETPSPVTDSGGRRNKKKKIVLDLGAGAGRGR